MLETIKNSIYINEKSKKIIPAEKLMDKVSNLGVRWFVKEIMKANSSDIKKVYCYMTYKYLLILKDLEEELSIKTEYNWIFGSKKNIYETANVLYSIPLYVLNDFKNFNHETFWLQIKNKEVLKWLQFGFIKFLYIDGIIKKDNVFLIY